MKKVLIAAGASGIGLAIARAFHGDGARVYICDIDQAALARAAGELPGMLTRLCNLGDREQVTAMVADAAQRLGGLEATKWALIGFTRTLSIALGRYGIRVNAIAPGAVAGERAERVFQGRAQASGRSIEEEERIGLEGQSLKALVDPNDIAALAVFPASDAGKSISGQVLPIDGDMQRA
jgi:NAD(P)-dependent dehydrogenase (short-subunit alcohol dehydrogenase family)